MDKLFRDNKPGGSFESSGCETMKFRILREGSKTKIKITILDFINAYFALFMDLLE